MRSGLFVAGCLAAFAGSASAQATAPVAPAQAAAPVAPAPTPAADMSRAAARSLLDDYCVRCHNQRAAVGRDTGVTWDTVDLTRVADHAEVLERAVRRLRAGMMPPAGSPRPGPEAYAALTEWLEAELDRHAVPRLPPPGLHRLNRSEYANVVRDLLAVEVDASRLLPSDDSSRGFDNQAGTLSLSPALLEAYLSAAARISRLAVGSVATPTQTVYRVAEDATQNYHVDGLPFGTRGGLQVRHLFPAAGEYALRVVPVNMGNMGNTRPFGEVRGEQLEILLDGERAALVDWDEALGVGSRGRGARELAIDLRIPVEAGPHTVGVTFLATNLAPGLDLNDAFLRSTIETGGLPGFTFYPHVGSLRIDGPYDAAGAGDTPSRRRIFVCRPAGADDEEPCAEEILSALARRAYRQPASPADLDTVMRFYRMGRESGSFEDGVEMGLQRILADPRFIYRVEVEPAGLAPGDLYPISDLELASRLSFFLWSSSPDDDLLELAGQGRLSQPAVLEGQVRRMLADRRSAELAANFAGQWLTLRSLESQVPVVDRFPDFDDNLRQALRRETELFFASVVAEDRSVLDLLTADYTFVNERLARHYGIPNVSGSRFRRVALGDGHDARRGLLGKGGILTVSSQPGRTSPVQRGKWVLQNLLGVVPPDPPPDVPDLPPPADDPAGNAREPSMREHMERHRGSPVCAACHRLMDPIGFSLEHFDAIGGWRDDEHGMPIDASDVLYDGSAIDGPAGLRRFLLRYSDQFVRTVTEKLLTYALGRGVEHHDMPAVRAIVREAEADDYRFTALVLGVVGSDAFRMNTKVGDAAPAARQASAP